MYDGGFELGLFLFILSHVSIPKEAYPLVYYSTLSTADNDWNKDQQMIVINVFSSTLFWRRTLICNRA